MPAAPAAVDASSAPLVARVEAALATIRPAVRDDGGDVELVDVTAENVARVRFHGACVGCPSSELTLKHAIERNIMSRVPEVQRVEAVA